MTENYLVYFYTGTAADPFLVETGEFVTLKDARRYARLWAYEGRDMGHNRVASVRGMMRRGKRPERGVWMFVIGKGIQSY